MSDDIIPLIKVHEYFRGLCDEALQEVVRYGRSASHARIAFPNGEKHGKLRSEPVTVTIGAKVFTLVAHDTANAAGERLVGEPVLNAVIVLLVITSVLGPILTERYARQLSTTEQQGDLKRPPFVIAVSDDEHPTLV
jgi:hypothetical protein